MKRFIGTKLLTAKPMTRGEYNEYRGWAPPDKEDQTVPGYLVEYLDGGGANDVRHTGYISWSPKDVFDAAYRPCHEMTFGLAIEALKRGDTVARQGWNGAGMFVYLVPANAYPAQTSAAKAYFGDGGMVPYYAYLALVGPEGGVSTWAPSVSDVLAEDWVIVNVASEAPIDAKFEPPRPAHQQRVVTERDELADKISKLAGFLVTPTYQRLADEEQTRLANQLDVMRLYCTVLNQRIDAFPV